MPDIFKARTIRYIFLSLCFLIHSFSSNAQEMLGAVSSNYAGMTALLVNPSSMVDSRVKFDINLLTIGVSVDNDYLYIPKNNLSFLGFGKISDALQHKYTGYTDAKN